MAKRKFSLSDIIKKLQPEQIPPDTNIHSEEQSAQKSAPPQMVNAPSPEQQAPAEQDALPGQPVPGRRGFSARKVPRTALAVTARPTVNQSAPEVDARPEMPRPNNPASAFPNHTAAPPPLTNKDEDEGDGFDFWKYLGVLLRRKKIIIAALIVATIYGLFCFLTSDKYYIAHARLLFHPEEKLVNGEFASFMYMRDKQNMLSTHLELLHSPTVLAMVADSLDNKISASQIAAGLTIAQGSTNQLKTDIIDLTFNFRDPQIAKDVLNELCTTYIAYRCDVNAQEDTRLIFRLEQQIGSVQADYDKKADALREFKEQNQMVDISASTGAAISKQAGIESSIQDNQMALMENRQRRAEMNSQISKEQLETVQSVTYANPVGAKLADLEMQLQELSAEYSPEHYKVKMLKEQIDKLKEAASLDIAKEVTSKTYEANPAREGLVSDALKLAIDGSVLESTLNIQRKLNEQSTQEMMKFPLLQQKYANLERETEALLDLLKMLKSKYEEAKIKKDSQESELKILELAQTPRTPLSKFEFKNVFIFMLVGLGAGIALAFLFEFLDQSIKEPSAVERDLELPLLGIVPFIDAEKALLDDSSKLAKNILEPFRALRTNVKHLLSTKNFKTIIICSAVKGEGKTTLAANIAITFAMDGKKVILIDGDLRRSQMHHLFDIPKENGFTDYLMASKELDDIIKPTRFDNLFVITSGERPQNPAELLGTYRLDTMLQEIREKADLIIIDSPALLPVSDTLTMAPKLDGCIMVVRSFWTPLKAARQAQMQLKRIGSNIIGGILNGVSHSRGYYPYYYGYYGYYSYKYSYDEDAKKPFSLREAGLEIEKRLRTAIKNAGYGMPGYIATGGSFLGRLSRRKTFWILLLLLGGTLGTRVVVQFMFKPSYKSEIRYLGPGSTAPVNVLPDSQAADSPRPISTDTPGVNSGLQKDTGAGGGAAAQDSGSGDTQTVFPGYRDSVARWVDAQVSGNLFEYLSWYDTSLFKSDKGGFTELRDDAINTVVPGENGKNDIAIDSIWQERSSPTTSRICAIVNNRSAHRTARYDMIWNKGKDGWRIVRQREDEINR